MSQQRIDTRRIEVTACSPSRPEVEVIVPEPTGEWGVAQLVLVALGTDQETVIGGEAIPVGWEGKAFGWRWARE